MNCIYCNHNKIYILKTTQAKCAKCKKKFSVKKLNQQKKIISCFCNNFSAYTCSEKLLLNYTTVKKQYEKLRLAISIYLENEFINENVKAYEEYLYIEKSKRNKKENIFNAKGIMCFEYDNKVYSLLMPSLNKYKEEYILNSDNKDYLKDFSRFMMFNKIQKTNKNQNIIESFCLYFENEILKYKGIKDDSFFYYLKEIEFKFNYTKDKQEKILNNLLHYF